VLAAAAVACAGASPRSGTAEPSSRPQSAGIEALPTASAVAAPDEGPIPLEPPPMTQSTTDALSFLRASITPFPDGAAASGLALTDPSTRRAAVYDSALLVLTLVRWGQRPDAGRLVMGLYALQDSDGSVPFSLTLPRETGVRYVRSGAVAWVGLAAVDFLDSQRTGPARDEARTVARRAASYLMGRQVAQQGDPRDGLVRGGEGAYRYELDSRGAVKEVLVEEDVAWVSAEHNIDAYFFLRALGRVTGDKSYTAAAARIATGLARLWNGSRGQLDRGANASGTDSVLELDCASWGSVFWSATGDLAKAETSAAVADAGYASTDPKTKASGHRARLSGPVLEGDVLRRALEAKLPARDWRDLAQVWPEGTAGVAFAALRVGKRERAKALLDQLEALRGGDGSVPTSTLGIPFLFDTKPSLAGTAWIELVRFELARPAGKPTLWIP
jgi:hypothetical protein